MCVVVRLCWFGCGLVMGWWWCEHCDVGCSLSWCFMRSRCDLYATYTHVQRVATACAYIMLIVRVCECGVRTLAAFANKNDSFNYTHDTTCTHTHTHTRRRIHTRTHTYTYTHTQSRTHTRMHCMVNSSVSCMCIGRTCCLILAYVTQMYTSDTASTRARYTIARGELTTQ